MKVLFTLIFTLFALLVHAEEVDVSKLPDSILTSAQIAELFAGKEVNGKNRRGNEVAYTFQKNGNVFFRSSSGHSDSGTWKTENDVLCFEFRGGDKACPTVVKVVSGKLQFDNWYWQK